jgi:hypothetical protein
MTIITVDYVSKKNEREQVRDKTRVLQKCTQLECSKHDERTLMEKVKHQANKFLWRKYGRSQAWWK